MASVIKSSLGARSGQPIVFNYEDVTKQMHRYVEETQAKADRIVADARQQAEAIRSRSADMGREAATAAAEAVLDEKVGKRMESLLPALQAAVTELTDAKQAWLRHWEECAVRLAAQIARRVIRREISREPEITKTLIREALQMAAGSPRVQIRLHPTDFETLGGQTERLAQELARTAHVEVVADATLTPGGCRLETRHGVIDQQIETQLERIVDELVGGNE